MAAEAALALIVALPGPCPDSQFDSYYWSAKHMLTDAEMVSRRWGRASLLPPDHPFHAGLSSRTHRHLSRQNGCVLCLRTTTIAALPLVRLSGLAGAYVYQFQHEPDNMAGQVYLMSVCGASARTIACLALCRAWVRVTRATSRESTRAMEVRC